MPESIKTKQNEKSYQFRQLVNIEEVARAKGDSEVQELKNAIHLKGFNSIFAVSSVEAAKLYYSEFQKQMKAHPEKAIKIATIYSFAANEEEEDGLLGEENTDDTSGLDATSCDFFDGAIKVITHISAQITTRRARNSTTIIRTFPFV